METSGNGMFKAAHCMQSLIYFIYILKTEDKIFLIDGWGRVSGECTRVENGKIIASISYKSIGISALLP